MPTMLIILILSMAAPTLWSQEEEASEATPEARALLYLAAEVRLWSEENHCFSCHNNGDGARVLYSALQKGYRIPQEALAETTQWLLKPAEWGSGANPGFKDEKLMRIQFTATLTQAYEAGLVGDRQVILQAAELLLPFQESNGSWQVRGITIGAPATYGPVLATYLAALACHSSPLTNT